MGTTGGQLLVLAGDAEVDPRTQEALVTMAKAVASATAALVTNAKNVAAKCDDQALQNQVIVAAKQTALATQGLIACTKVSQWELKGLNSLQVYSGGTVETLIGLGPGMLKTQQAFSVLILKLGHIWQLYGHLISSGVSIFAKTGNVLAGNSPNLAVFCPANFGNSMDAPEKSNFGHFITTL